MSIIFSLLSAVVTVYTILCFIDIILSWFPGAKFTSFGRFIASITEPYLNIFRRFRFLQIGYVDFSPVISLGVLSLISSILAGITSSGRFSLGRILATIFTMLWGVISSLLGFFILIVAVRFIALLIQKGKTSYNSMWSQLDNYISNIVYKISGTFIRKNTDYKTALLVSIIVLIAISVLGQFFFGIISQLCLRIPF